MPALVLNGTPGETYRNTTGKFLYQFICNWRNSCGVCCSYDRAVGYSWPLPLHWNCKCRSLLIPPGGESQPFVDFREKIAELPFHQQSRVVGSSNYRLIEKGVVSWDDVVTVGRVRDLREVVSLKRLDVAAMTRAGVPKAVAEAAHASVHTAAHEIAAESRKRLLDTLRAKGLSDEQVRRAVGERLAGRVTVGKGPGGAPPPPPGPVVLPAPGPKPRPLTGPELEKLLGVRLTPQAHKLAAPPAAPTPTPTPPGPAGKPVAEALDVRAGGDVGAAARTALDAVGRVHGDGELKRIPLRESRETTRNGAFLYFEESGEAFEITVSALGKSPALTAAHEIGHFIEGTGIPGGFKRDFATDPVFTEWLGAVQSSAAHKGLSATTTADPKVRKYVDYLSRGDELWARSYAQYVAVRSGDPRLLRELAESRVRDKSIQRQWGDEDFKPIAAAIDKLFEGLGWRS